MKQKQNHLKMSASSRDIVITRSEMNPTPVPTKYLLSEKEAIAAKSPHKKTRLQLENTQNTRATGHSFVGHVLGSDETKIVLIGHNDHCYICLKENREGRQA